MASKPTHVTKGDVLDDLGFSHSEATALKIKADLLDAILSQIKRHGFTQRDLVAILDEYQPNVSNLLKGKINSVSIEKLLGYSDRLKIGMYLVITQHPKARTRRSKPVSEMEVVC